MRERRARAWGLAAGVALLGACGGLEERGTEAPSPSTLLAEAPWPVHRPPVAVDDEDAGFELLGGDVGSHAYHRLGAWWQQAPRTGEAMGQGARVAAAGMTRALDGEGVTRAESASVASWTAQVEPGEYTLFAWVAPSEEYVTSAVYCVFEKSPETPPAPDCRIVDQTEGEPRWVPLARRQFAGTVQVLLDPVASLPERQRVFADAVVWMPTLHGGR